jgi:hypothetical protein
MPKQGTIYEEGPYSFNASEAIARGLGVKLGAAAKEVDLCDTQGEVSYGVAIHAKAAGEEVSVLRRGRFAGAISGAAIALHADVMVNAAGKYITAVATNVIVGKALTATSGADEEFVLELDTAERVA